VLVLGIDPGKRTGVAWLKKVDDKLVTLKVLAYKDSEFDFFLDNVGKQWEELDPEQVYKPIVVCEDFILRPTFNSGWTVLPTAEKIGAIRRVAYEHHWMFFKQQPSCMKVGCALMNIEYNPKKHLADELSALAHAAYFAINGGRRA
jgi:hypothetical protein